MKREYSYIGPEEILQSGEWKTARTRVRGLEDITKWIDETEQSPDAYGQFAATFIIDVDGNLWIADRHSEHVACARGGEVLSAGEISFTIEGENVEVSEITNQSTGYCPEPESWPIVDRALSCAGIPHSGNFTMEFIFRRCESCGLKNIVKEEWFECAVCGVELPKKWNFRRNE